MVSGEEICRFDSQAFSCFDNMVETLMHEANEQIVRIDTGDKKNTNLERMYARWRLQHLQQCFGECVPGVYRSTYNSLWSQLYRLEHQAGYRNPYVVYLLEKVLCRDSSSVV
ncbi:hypothetical protein [Aneurinibacillus aneurinilyticus]|jgi:hypothetical protein|uniref:Uncharacterized protein n=2 Tax=Aneurinibacillus aneurinilyticus TaxID=1391 RepID=A0A848CZ87_ANEAE|nr:hypothetical protein [Aneurinibacillus aneurinilyticus]ERI09686.1 hypothetical protein HMPREF0083_02200 [Aneurinibacillus aneurinilyticus ATCC 12856]MED0672616.1 hypothetical protein [Aneurinibacillus aneurinilyticus]MED0708420.1 hypothetical protein [Aneurinibacillus aneurinilyticus]MED0722513.1 hypothetical protein [Aneurinibacillus aneurinilyticus]MED0732446.1 hypothetical protein [Aneurinibacillus aneurinilyticus]